MKFLLKRKEYASGDIPTEEAKIEALYAWRGYIHKAFEVHEMCLDAKIIKTLNETGEVTVCFVMEAK